MPLWSVALSPASTANPSDAAAFMDLSIMLQTMGKHEEAMPVPNRSA